MILRNWVSQAFKGGLSFNIDDLIIPDEKEKLLVGANEEVDEVWRTTTWVLLPTTSVTTRLSISGRVLHKNYGNADERDL